jgi:predicted  nucleic acid-binding Zn-ribbon protein
MDFTIWVPPAFLGWCRNPHYSKGSQVVSTFRQISGAKFRNQIATESLRAACSAWESEREELNSIIQEISKEHDAGVNQNQELSQTIEKMQKQIDDVNKKILLAEHDNSVSGKLINEIEHRAKALESELEHAHKENNRLRNEREEACNELINDRETAARLAGRIDVLEKSQVQKNARRK